MAQQEQEVQATPKACHLGGVGYKSAQGIGTRPGATAQDIEREIDYLTKGINEPMIASDPDLRILMVDRITMLQERLAHTRTLQQLRSEASALEKRIDSTDWSTRAAWESEDAHDNLDRLYERINEINQRLKRTERRTT